MSIDIKMSVGKLSVDYGGMDSIHVELEDCNPAYIKKAFIQNILHMNFSNDEVVQILDEINGRTGGIVKDAVEYLGIMEQDGYYDRKLKESKL